MFKQFLLGTQYILKGIQLFYADKTLWRYVMMPLGILLVFYGLVAWGCLELASFEATFIGVLCEKLPEWIAWFGSCAKTLVWLFIVLSSGILMIAVMTTLFEIFGSFFFDKLIEEVERKHFAGTQENSSFPQNMLFVWDSFCFGLKTVFLTVVLLIVGIFFPVIGPLLMFVVMGYILGISYVSTTGYMHGIRLKQQLKKMRGFQMQLLGYGLGSYLLLLIPLSVFFLLPGIIVGGTLFYNQNFKEM